MASNEAFVRAMNFNVPETRALNIFSTDSQKCEQQLAEPQRQWETVAHPSHARSSKQESIKESQVYGQG